MEGINSVSSGMHLTASNFSEQTEKMELGDNSESSVAFFDCGLKESFNKNKLISDLKCWAIKIRVNNVQMKGLLNIWNKRVPLPHLPKDPRTLFKTPNIVPIFLDPNIEKEQYWYYGLKKALIDILQNIRNLPRILSLNFNIDGVPISRSSNECFWPILFNVHEIEYLKPAIISIYHGYSKYINI